MGAYPTPAFLEPSAPVSLMVLGSVESAQLATPAMESGVKMLTRYKFLSSIEDYSNICQVFSGKGHSCCSSSFYENSARRSQMLASSLMACTAVRIQTLATTACPALLATQERSPLAEAWSRLLLTNRQVNVPEREGDAR